jgi:ApbE superfamily uncharacterized protein (UPF0280 family)
VSEVDDYRSLVSGDGLISSRVRIRESDLLIRGDRDLARPARKSLLRHRREIEDYLVLYPAWGKSLVPVPAGGTASEIVTAMSRAAAVCQVGPMAAVAGALAWFVGRDLSFLSGELIVENGGDIYLNSCRERTILIGTGKGTAWPKNIGLRIPTRNSPIGVAAASGTGGRSLSWGKAAAAVVVAENSVVADAAATTLGNRVCSAQPEVLQAAVESIAALDSIFGCLVICENLLAVRGEIELLDPGDHRPWESSSLSALTKARKTDHF